MCTYEVKNLTSDKRLNPGKVFGWRGARAGAEEKEEEDRAAIEIYHRSAEARRQDI